MAKEITGADLVKLEDAYNAAVRHAFQLKRDKENGHKRAIQAHPKAVADAYKAYDALAKAREQFPNPQPWGKYSAGIPDFE